jgi:cysteine synthase B
MQAEGRGIVLDQFSNPDNPLAHHDGTGPEIWTQTDGQVTHFVSAMGTTGTIMGVGSYLRERNPAIRIIGAQPADGAHIPGIRKWPEAYQPSIYDPSAVDAFEPITQEQSESMARRLAAEEGISGGLSSAGAAVAALRVAATVRNATIVFIVCDRSDRYLSTGVFDAQPER